MPRGVLRRARLLLGNDPDAQEALQEVFASLLRSPRSLRSAGYPPEDVNIALVTHLHADHVGGLTTEDGKRSHSTATRLHLRAPT